MILKNSEDIIDEDEDDFTGVAPVDRYDDGSGERDDYSLFLDCDIIIAAADVVSVQDTAEEIAAWNVKCVCGMSGVVGNFKWLYISCIVTYWCGVCTFHFLGDRITGCSSGCGERASVKGS